MKSSEKPIRELVHYFFTHYRAAIITGILAIIIVDLAELSLPLLLKRIIDVAHKNIAPELVRSTLVGISIIIFAQVSCRYLWRVSLARGAMNAGADFRDMFSRQIFEIPFTFFEKRKVGELMTLATSDVENMRLALGPGLISLIDSVFYCVAIPFVMFSLSPEITFKVLIPVIGIPIAVVVLQQKIAVFSREVQEQIGKLGTQTQEMVAGVRLAKIYGVESRIEARLNKSSNALNRNQVALSKAQAMFGPVLEFFLSSGLIILFGLGASVSIGTLVAMQRYLQKLMWPMSAVGMAVVYFQKAKSSGLEFYQFLEEPKTEALTETHESLFQLKSNVPVILAKNLNYGVIKNLSFEVKEGEWLGIEGKVAAGKSTLLSLLLKFYEVPRGQLFVNGIDMNDWKPGAVRKFFTSVMQDPYLFRGSIRSNLEVGEELDLLEALQIAQVQGSLIDERLNEELGEKGSGLSGGQKQRIAIARALRKSAPVLLLDDPLSSVDLITAELVLESLVVTAKKLNKTVILVSHHPEHLLYCDRIIRLEAGGLE